MKRKIVNFICMLFLMSIVFSACERHYYEGRGDDREHRRHHRDRDHKDHDHQGDDHRDNN
jgi:hypothetical protein